MRFAQMTLGLSLRSVVITIMAGMYPGLGLFSSYLLAGCSLLSMLALLGLIVSSGRKIPDPQILQVVKTGSDFAISACMNTLTKIYSSVSGKIKLAIKSIRYHFQKPA